MLVRLIYASSADSALTPADVDAIVSRSTRHNAQDGITGALCHDGHRFLQVLEGGRDEVNRLYAQIIRDSRHHDVVLLDYAEITARRFDGWTMGRVNLSKVNPSVLLKYGARASFEPQTMSGRVAIALLEELISTAAIAGRTDAGR
ncbi:MAG: BLUF domain-containing protein [Burkholderiaceae bacterium]|nr:BLUF domain-containing protein [Burkholderiaceae bacterium]